MILFVYFDSNTKLDIMVHIFRGVSGYVHSLSWSMIKIDVAMHQQPDRMIVVYIYKQEAEDKQKRLKERARQLIEEARAGIGHPEVNLPKRPSKDLTEENGTSFTAQVC